MTEEYRHARGPWGQALDMWDLAAAVPVGVEVPYTDPANGRHALARLTAGGDLCVRFNVEVPAAEHYASHPGTLVIGPRADL